MSVQSRLTKLEGLERERDARAAADLFQAAERLSKDELDAVIAVNQLFDVEWYRDGIPQNELLELASGPDAAKALVTLAHAAGMVYSVRVSPATRRYFGWPDPDEQRAMLAIRFDGDVARLQVAIDELRLEVLS